MYCIYCHRNMANGKRYIGITRSDNLRNRWRNGKGYSRNLHFSNAIEKYGWDGFEHTVLIDGLNAEQAYEKETEMIKQYKTTDPQYGYNISNGGKYFFAGLHHTEDAKRRISEKMKRYEKTESHKKHISEKKRGVLHHRAKKVFQYTKGGNLIKEWEYMNLAAETLGIKKESISATCLGKRPSAGGFVWSYERR